MRISTINDMNPLHNSPCSEFGREVLPSSAGARSLMTWQKGGRYKNLGLAEIPQRDLGPLGTRACNTRSAREQALASPVAPGFLPRHYVRSCTLNALSKSASLPNSILQDCMWMMSQEGSVPASGVARLDSKIETDCARESSVAGSGCHIPTKVKGRTRSERKRPRRTHRIENAI